jgi:phenylacetate-CoA ligase
VTTTTRIDPWALLLRHIIQPLYYFRQGDRRFSRLREIEKNQWLSRAALEQLQLRRVNELLRHAYDTTDFYRQRLDDCGLGGRPVAALSDLAVLEPVTKADVQRHGSAMISRSYRKEDLIEDASGGSTGTPTVLYKDLDRYNLRRADQLRHDRWTGWDIGVRWALVWGARQDLIDERSLRERIVERYIQRCISLDAFELSDDRMREYAERLKAFGPAMILGYANALDQLADFVLRNGLKDTVRPMGIVSSAERLTAEMRIRIQSAFGCPVLDRYGSREVGLIASECGSGAGLHINADNLLVEVLNKGRPAGPGESGDVVVTDFWNFGMPLIRYNMADRAVVATSECSCGRKLPMLASIEGRSSDFLTSADGTRIHGEFFTHLFYGETAVAQFQFVQESVTHVTINIVLAGIGPLGNIDEIVKKTKRVLGEQTMVDVRYCESIPPTPSGKFRFTISNVTK